MSQSQGTSNQLQATELIGLIEGTVEDMKQYINKNSMTQEQLNQLLEAEKNSKNRKTAKEFLKTRIYEKNTQKKQEKTSEDSSEASETIEREALLQLLGGTVEDMKEYVKENNPSDDKLQQLLHAEKMVQNRKTVLKFLKSYSKKKKLEESFHEAEHDLAALKNDLEELEGEVFDGDLDLELDEIDLEQDESDEEEETDEPEEDGEVEEESETEEEAESEDVEETEDSEEQETGEESEAEAEDSEDELSEMEEKRQILEELDMELSEEKLEEISLEELEKLKAEKEKREELIQKLSSEFEREKLEQTTTNDLKKLAEQLDTSNEDSEEEEKNAEEIEEEAKEDLQMLMGAVKASDNEDEDEGPGTLDELRNLPDKVKNTVHRGSDEEEEEETGFNDEEVIEVLEGYREMESKEAAIKTAQIMKAYLEYNLGIDRELTYKELSDEIESRDLNSQNFEQLRDFYEAMKKSVYTGEVEINNINEVIDAAEKTVKEL